MRNNNRDIVIHHLIERTTVLSRKTYRRFDYIEKLSQRAENRKKISIIRNRELEREKNGTWRSFKYDGLNYTLLIPYGQNEEDSILNFIDKLKKREENGFTGFVDSGCGCGID